MRIHHALLAALLLALPAALQARDFEWPGHGTISFDVPDGWKIQGQPAEDVGYSFIGRPESGAAAFLQITVVNLPPDKPVTAAELPDRLQASLLPYIEQSVEKEFRPIPLKTRQGKGWYAELSDASLVGKPPATDDYKVMRSAVISFDQRTLVIATMQFDDPAASAAAEMLAIVGSIGFEHTRTDRKPAR